MALRLSCQLQVRLDKLTIRARGRVFQTPGQLALLQLSWREDQRLLGVSNAHIVCPEDSNGLIRIQFKEAHRFDTQVYLDPRNRLPKSKLITFNLEQLDPTTLDATKLAEFAIDLTDVGAASADKDSGGEYLHRFDFMIGPADSVLHVGMCMLDDQEKVQLMPLPFTKVDKRARKRAIRNALKAAKDTNPATAPEIAKLLRQLDADDKDREAEELASSAMARQLPLNNKKEPKARLAAGEPSPPVAEPSPPVEEDAGGFFLTAVEEDKKKLAREQSIISESVAVDKSQNPKVVMDQSAAHSELHTLLVTLRSELEATRMKVASLEEEAVQVKSLQSKDADITALQSAISSLKKELQIVSSSKESENELRVQLARVQLERDRIAKEREAMEVKLMQASLSFHAAPSSEVVSFAKAKEEPQIEEKKPKKEESESQKPSRSSSRQQSKPPPHNASGKNQQLPTIRGAQQKQQQVQAQKPPRPSAAAVSSTKRPIVPPTYARNDLVSMQNTIHELQRALNEKKSSEKKLQSKLKELENEETRLKKLQEEMKRKFELKETLAAQEQARFVKEKAEMAKELQKRTFREQKLAEKVLQSTNARERQEMELTQLQHKIVQQAHSRNLSPPPMMASSHLDHHVHGVSPNGNTSADFHRGRERVRLPGLNNDRDSRSTSRARFVLPSDHEIESLGGTRLPRLVIADPAMRLPQLPVKRNVAPLPSVEVKPSPPQPIPVQPPAPSQPQQPPPQLPAIVDEAQKDKAPTPPESNVPPLKQPDYLDDASIIKVNSTMVLVNNDDADEEWMDSPSDVVSLGRVNSNEQ